MKTIPLITIIVTSFNVEKYIAKCLLSLINQTIEDTEVIVIDDGSSDNTVKIIKEIKKYNDRLTLIELKKNTIGGAGAPSNIGIRNATGKYIGFADGDDWYEPEMFEQMLKEAEVTNADMVLCNYLLYNETNFSFSDPADKLRWIDLKKVNKNKILSVADKKKILSMISVPWRKLYRRDFLIKNDIYFPVGDFFFEDNPFHWYTTICANKISFLDKVFCYHRIFRDGQTMSSKGNVLIKIFNHHDIIKIWLCKKGIFSVYRDSLLRWFINQVAWTSRSIESDNLNKYLKKIDGLLKDYSIIEIINLIKYNNIGPYELFLSLNIKLKNYEKAAKIIKFQKKSKLLMAIFILKKMMYITKNNQ